jgi:hypothetical protein
MVRRLGPRICCFLPPHGVHISKLNKAMMVKKQLLSSLNSPLSQGHTSGPHSPVRRRARRSGWAPAWQSGQAAGRVPARRPAACAAPPPPAYSPPAPVRPARGMVKAPGGGAARAEQRRGESARQPAAAACCIQVFNLPEASPPAPPRRHSLLARCGTGGCRTSGHTAAASRLQMPAVREGRDPRFLSIQNRRNAPASPEHRRRRRPSPQGPEAGPSPAARGHGQAARPALGIEAVVLGRPGQ